MNIKSKNIKESLASLALEGIHPSPELMADLELFDAGKISEEECIKRALARAKDQNNQNQAK